MQKIYTTIDCGRFDCVYEVAGDTNSTALQKYIIHDGYKLFEIKATYTKQLLPATYFVVEKNSRLAKERFKGNFPWLGYITSVFEVVEQSKEIILNNPKKYAVI